MRITRLPLSGLLTICLCRAAKALVGGGILPFSCADETVFASKRGHFYCHRCHVHARFRRRRSDRNGDCKEIVFESSGGKDIEESTARPTNVGPAVRCIARAIRISARTANYSLVPDRDFELSVNYIERFVFIQMLVKRNSFFRRVLNKHPHACSAGVFPCCFDRQ